jgi:hypothetical protein
MKNHFACVRTLAIFLSAGLLAACAGYAPNDTLAGKNRAAVIEALGQPFSETTIANGTRLNFPRGPFGKHTYFVFLDSEGRVSQWAQVLTEKNFDLIKPGMSQNDVIGIIGESKEIFGLSRGRGYVWNYRFVSPHCFWFQIEFTAQNAVRSTGYSRPPECRVRGRG